MQTARLPYDEAERISNLLSYEILDTEREKKFDDLVTLAAQVSDCKYALISFIDSKRQWFKATHGINISETNRSISVCAHTILGDKTVVINDTRKDKRFFDNPNVV
ncbi:MAG: GAF domain-containing protein, partial [Ferruginibacter sp.]|nr:GAF domain-containing protein [Ferruginibacter sp.]